MTKAKLFIGTSGWSYPHWDGIFYPENLSSGAKLKYFSQHFRTVEVNYSFYHLPRPSTYQKWYQETPVDFIFALKVSRFITHIKKLKEVKEAWKTFLGNALGLKGKLGPILFQFPPNWKKDTLRLKGFLGELQESDQKQRFVFEFRHPSWFSEETYQLFKKYKNVSLCLADSPRWPFVEVITGDFVYIRMHGGKILYTSNYSIKELKNWAEKIKKYLKQGLDTYVYFNNDAYGYALGNAKRLLTLCS